jgi:hypothetical protein
MKIALLSLSAVALLIASSAFGDTCLEAEVFPAAMTPFHALGPMSGFTDFRYLSPRVDQCDGAPSGRRASFIIGSGQIFLTLTASDFPLVEGMVTETVSTNTANANATVQLT